jgi:hypothetical protein
MIGLAAALCAPAIVMAPCAPPAGPVAPPPSVLLAAALSPRRPGDRASLTLSLRYRGSRGALPAPLQRATLQLSAGMSLFVPRLRSCTAMRLRARGVRGCPVQAQLGTGHALVQVHVGSQTVNERVALHAFLGPPRNLQPTFEVLAQAFSPVQQSLVIGGLVQPGGGAPYGEALVLSIPPIPTLPLAPEGSIVALTLTVGVAGHNDRSSVLVPSFCPPRGFPFAAELTYVDGSTDHAQATIPCPR